ncbi:hypothetical protein JCM3770_001174 [Rhodotorula araucariae]
MGAATFDHLRDAHTPGPHHFLPQHTDPLDAYYRPYPSFGGYELDPWQLYSPYIPPAFPPHGLQGYPAEPTACRPFFPSPPPIQHLQPYTTPSPMASAPMHRRATVPYRRGSAHRSKSLRELLDSGEHIPSRGRVKFFNARKGYGFIVDDQNADLQADVFAHYTGVDLQNGFRCLAKDERVEYILTTHSKGGYQALCITGEHGALSAGQLPTSRAALTPAARGLDTTGAPLRGLSDAHNAAIVREMAAETNANRMACVADGAGVGASEVPAGSASEPVVAACAVVGEDDAHSDGDECATVKKQCEGAKEGEGRPAKSDVASGLMLSGADGDARR